MEAIMVTLDAFAQKFLARKQVCDLPTDEAERSRFAHMVWIDYNLEKKNIERVLNSEIFKQLSYELGWTFADCKIFCENFSFDITHPLVHRLVNDYHAIYSVWWHTKIPHHLALGFAKHIDQEKLRMEFRVNGAQYDWVMKIISQNK